MVTRGTGWASVGVESVLHGRSSECSLLEQVIESAAAGRGGALALRGDEGVGKTALLAHAERSAGGAQILRAAGVRNQAELPFAALHQLLRPLASRTAGLPRPQAAALDVAFGVTAGGRADPLAVALGALTLLAEAATDRPVLCVVDDAQWLDRPTADALRFVGDRLPSERVVLLIATLHGTHADPFAGIPELPVGPLDDRAARRLLEHRHPALDAAVRELLLAEAGGNALALAELPRALTEAQRTGQAEVPVPLPVPAPVLDRHREQLLALPPDSRTMVLIAAAERRGELDLVLRAAAELDVGSEALDAVEAAGLLVVDERAGAHRVRFRIPLVSASVYACAPFSQRVAVHRALARALAADGDAERRAWHLAACTVGPDPAAAADLRRGGLRALQRGDSVRASALLERAAQLSGSARDRARVLAEAAGAAYAAGRPARAETLVTLAETTHDDPVVRAEIRMLRARMMFERGSPAAAHRLLLDGCAPVAATHPDLAAEMLADAVKNGWFMNDPGRVRDAASALTEVRLPGHSALAPLVDTVLDLGSALQSASDDPTVRLRRLLERHEDRSARSSSPRHPLEAILSAVTAIVIGRDADAVESAGAAEATCREQGQREWLPLALQVLSSIEMLVGAHRSARARAEEGLALANGLGQENRACHFRSVLAWLDGVAGAEDTSRELAARSLHDAEVRRMAPTAAVARWALGVLDLGLGRPAEALEPLRTNTASGAAHPLVVLRQVPDLVEAAAKADRGAEVESDLKLFEDWTAASDQAWAKAAALRCRALLEVDDEVVEQRFRAALKWHDVADRIRMRSFDRARTQLLYGEWLRRKLRRADARAQLVAASTTFTELAAQPWLDRANAELRATRGSVARGAAPLAGRLTAQELQVVQLAGAGASNREIAARLFLSPRTVAYHLYKAFPKLGVSSRTELAHLRFGGTDD